MPKDFNTEWYVRRCKVPHICKKCGRTIEIGEPATKAVMRDNTKRKAADPEKRKDGKEKNPKFEGAYFCTDCAEYKGKDAEAVNAEKKMQAIPAAVTPLKPKKKGVPYDRAEDSGNA
jgi:hypothetical protein